MPGIEETVHIPEGPSVAAFLGKVDWINRRARTLRLGLSLACEETGREPRQVRVTRDVFVDGALQRVSGSETRPCVLFRISCPEPVIRIPGWEFEGYIAARNGERDSVTDTVKVASYTPFTAGGKLPQDVLDGAFSERGMMRCDHCGTFRNRRIGIVVRDADGGRKVVGSNCSRDFLGHDFKAVAAYFQHIGALSSQVNAERNVGWYALHTYDFEQARLAEAAAAARRDGTPYPVRTVVGAILKAMGRQGFYARTSWEGRTATSEAALGFLEEGFSLSEGVWGKVDEILAWMGMQPGYAALFADPERRTTLGDYRAVDPEFRSVKAFMDGGGVPLGRFYADGEKVRLWKVSSVPEEAQRQVGWRMETVHKTRHVLRDDCGSRFELLTGSTAIDAVVASGEPFEATLTVRSTRLAGVRAHTYVSRLHPVRKPTPREPARAGPARRRASAPEPSAS